jgi:hypothetical protein
LYSFDASSIVKLWDDYPIDNPVFSSLWQKFQENIDNGIFTISNVALKESKDKIDSSKFNQLVINITTYEQKVDDLRQTQQIKDLLNIVEDNYGIGVGENDIFIIVIAKRTNTILVNDEKRQNNLPQNKTKYKIPAVCNLSEVQLQNINLTELLNIKNLWQ